MNLPSSTSHYYVSIVPRSHWQKMSLMFLMSLRILQSWGGGTYYVLHSGNNSKVDSSSAKLDLGDRSQTMKLLCCVLFKFQAELKTPLTQLEQTDKISIPDSVLSGFQNHTHKQFVKVSKSQKQILKYSFEPKTNKHSFAFLPQLS